MPRLVDVTSRGFPSWVNELGNDTKKHRKAAVTSVLDNYDNLAIHKLTNMDRVE
jgi:hypothetical protein